ncbi:hypothetical protein MPER_08818 [Moniliophthora perniciosa FA553]|nr:hypothetical protein MPER_08818 [Moniliophthora perniciosa FA553]
MLGSNFTEILESWNTSWYWSELTVQSDGSTKLGMHVAFHSKWWYLSGILLAVAPIVSGTVTGSAVNGTVRGGIAYAYADDDDDGAIVSNTTTWSYATVWGTTSDGTPFVVQESGEGTNTRHIAKLDVDIGGNYTRLANTFILAEVLLNATNVNANTTAISVKAYGAW